MSLDLTPLIKPQEFIVEDEDGVPHRYIISKFNSVVGRDICVQYIGSGLPKIGDYALNKQMAAEIMKYVAVEKEEGKFQRLSSEALIINHIPDWEMRIKIEKEMMKYNFRFFRDGKVLTFLDDIIQAFLQKALGMSIPSSETLSQADAQPSTNSEPSTI